MSEVYQWNPTDASNVDPAKSGTPEGMARSNVNNREREHMGAIRRFYAAPEWLRLYRDGVGDALVVSKIDNTHYRVVGADVTAISVAGRRVRMTPGAIQARIVSSVFAAGNTDVTIAGGVVPAALTEVELFFATALGLLAFSDSISSGFYIPATPDSAGIQAAIAAADAAGGGIVLLDQASYAIDAAINVASNVVVFAAGRTGALAVVAGALNAIPFTMQSRSGLVGFQIDAAAQAFGTRDCIRLAAGATRVLLEDLRLESPDRDGIALLDSNQKVRIAGVQIITPGRDGVRCEDPDSDAKEILVSDVIVADPGRTTNGARGFLFAGRVQATNLHVELTRAAPKAQVGIELATKAGGSGLTHARTCAVHGFTIQGASEDATGVWIGGRGCVVANGAIHLPGNSSRGIRFDSTGAGQVADHNVVSGVTIEAADLSVLFQADAYDNTLLGCRVVDSQTTDVEERGHRNAIRDCAFVNSAGAGVVIFGSSEDLVFVDCSIESVAGIAVDYSAGPVRLRARNIVLRENATDFAHATTPGGAVITNGGATTYGTSTTDDFGRPQRDSFLFVQNADIVEAAGVVAVHDDKLMDLLEFPLPPDGQRAFLVEWLVSATHTAGGGALTVVNTKLHSGATGTIADATAFTGVGNAVQRALVTPAAGARLSLSLRWSSSGGTVTFGGGSSKDLNSTTYPDSTTWVRIEAISEH